MPSNNRVVLTDGRWFNVSKAEAFKEGTRWNGNNHASLVTGSEWVHQMLYRACGGRWILHCWSQWQGSQPSYEEVSAEDQ